MSNPSPNTLKETLNHFNSNDLKLTELKNKLDTELDTALNTEGLDNESLYNELIVFINNIQTDVFDIVNTCFDKLEKRFSSLSTEAKAEAAEAAKVAEAQAAAPAPPEAVAQAGGGGKKKQMPTTTSSRRRARAPLYTINSGSSVVKEVLAYRFARNVLKRYYRTNKYMIGS